MANPGSFKWRRIGPGLYTAKDANDSPIWVEKLNGEWGLTYNYEPVAAFATMREAKRAAKAQADYVAARRCVVQSDWTTWE